MAMNIHLDTLDMKIVDISDYHSAMADTYTFFSDLQ